MTTTNIAPSRIALVTGGSRGLGKNMVLALADRGVDIILTYKSAEKEAHDVVAAIQAKGRKAVALQLDVSKSSTFEAFAGAVKSALGTTFGQQRFDVLVNNAGTGLHVPFMETTEAQFDDLVNIHLKATFFLSQKLLPLVNDGGRVLNVSSGLARFSIPGASAYGAVKGGIEVLTRYMAKELGARKISVNVIAPGAIETDFGGGGVRDNEQMNKMVASITALGRAGLPDDIGPVVALLLDPASGWINGQRLEVSGGMNL